MKNTFILIFILLISYTSHSQNNDNEGYFGAKNFATVEVLLSNPMIYNYRSRRNGNTPLNKNLDESSDKLNTGFRINYGRIVKRNVALCIEAGIDYSNVYLEYSNEGSYYYNKYYYKGMSYVLKSEKLDIETYTIMPKVEFSTKHALLPLGFSHQIGFGVSTSKLKNRDYNLELYQYNDDNYYNGNYQMVPNSKEFIKDNFYNYANANRIKTYTFLYALSVRTAITKQIFINYGFRYALNVTLGNFFTQNTDDINYLIQNSDIRREVARQKTSNIITFNLGMTYAF